MATTVNLLGVNVPILALIALLPLFGALINLILGRWLSKSTIHTIAILAVAASCVLSIYMVAGPLWREFKMGNGGIGIDPPPLYTWMEVGVFKVQLAFRLDTLSAVMILIVTFVGTLIHIYSTAYMHSESEAGYARY